MSKGAGEQGSKGVKEQGSKGVALGKGRGGKRAPEAERPFVVGTWRGRTQWRCRACPWDTLDGEAAIMEHIQAAHTPKPPPRRAVTLPLVDRFGNPITVEKEVTTDG